MQTQAWLQSAYDRILILYAMKQFPSNTNKWDSVYILLDIWDAPDQNLMAIKEHVILLPKSFFFLLNLNNFLDNLGTWSFTKDAEGIFFFIILGSL